MRHRMITSMVEAFLSVALATGVALAHITPPVVLVSERDALVRLLAGAQRFFVKEVRLSAEERQTIQQQWGWSPDDEFYRFYVGRDEQSTLVATTIFMTDFTIHGPVRVAVGIGPDGKVKGATVMELTEETYSWVEPLIDQNFLENDIRQDSRGRVVFSERLSKTGMNSMTQFYARVIAGLIQRGAILYEVAILRRGAAD